jgi:hypothetical protein
MDEQAPSSGFLLTDEEADEAGLPRPGCADQEQEVAIGDRQANAPEGVRPIRICLPDLLEADDRVFFYSPGCNHKQLL